MTGPLDWSRDGAHWPHRSASRFVDAGGCAWHVQVLRSAPGQPVLWLLHGTGAASHSWRALMDLLAPHATLVVPDLPGHGFSGPLPGVSLPGMARALAALADALATRWRCSGWWRPPAPRWTARAWRCTPG